jgi:PEP-CTERM motif
VTGNLSLVAAIPEPGSALLGAIGLIALLRRRR